MHYRAAPSHLLPLLLLFCLIGGAPRSSLPTASTSRVPTTPGKRPPRRFAPSAYAALQRAIHGAAAIAHTHREKPFASGVLIARDTVLTARHITFKHRQVPGRAEPPRLAPRNLEVRFDYVDREDGTLARFATWPVTSYVENEQGHDLILLKLGRNAAGRLPPASRVQQVSNARPKLDDAVYVVGFPEGAPLRVADDGRVLYPFEATGKELDELLRRAHSADHTAILESYVRQPDGRFLGYSTAFRGHPTLGVDSDTVEGMSGAGVYLKRTGELIGILFDGQPQARMGAPRGWSTQEAVAPLGTRAGHHWTARAHEIGLWIAKTPEHAPPWR